MAAQGSARRADAQQNRDRILDVARDVQTASPDASLNAIAKAAGVGAGTLYRHFPNREALALGVYHAEFRDLVELAPALIVEHAPLDAFICGATARPFTAASRADWRMCCTRQ